MSAPDTNIVKMHATTPLSADRDQLDKFIGHVFKHADPEGRISLRGFLNNDQSGPAVILEDAKRGDPTLLELAVATASKAANDERGIVFSPPIATFNNVRSNTRRGFLRATTENLRQGLTLSVELDKNPTAGRRKLELLLGAATVVVASGGTTEEGEDKLHCHWVLTKPTDTETEHADLKEARALACRLVGADASGTSIVHPYRWPGSWHTKRAPRLVKIASESDNEIDLAAALKKLREACPKTENHTSDSDPTASIALVEAALAVIPNTKDNGNADYWQKIAEFATEPDYNYWNKVGMAVFRATAGAGEGAFDRWSKKSPEYDADDTKQKWQAFEGCPPTQIGAGTLFRLADAATPGWRRAEQVARNIEIGDDITESILPVIMTLAEMHERLVFVGSSSAVVDRFTGRVRKKENATSEYAASRHVYVRANGNRVEEPALKLWIASRARITVDVLAWVPGEPQICRSPEGTDTAFNCWRGMKTMDAPEDWKERAAAFLSTLNTWCPSRPSASAS